MAFMAIRKLAGGGGWRGDRLRSVSCSQGGQNSLRPRLQKIPTVDRPRSLRRSHREGWGMMNDSLVNERKLGARRGPDWVGFTKVVPPRGSRNPAAARGHRVPWLWVPLGSGEGRVIKISMTGSGGSQTSLPGGSNSRASDCRTRESAVAPGGSGWSRGEKRTGQNQPNDQNRLQRRNGHRNHHPHLFLLTLRSG